MRAFLIVASLSLVGCVHEPKPVGVSEREATLIASQFVRQHASPAFGLAGPFDSGRTGLFTTAGDADIPVGIEIPPLLVDKATGLVTWDATAPFKK
jgi:hypothetical protein